MSTKYNHLSQGINVYHIQYCRMAGNMHMTSPKKAQDLMLTSRCLMPWISFKGLVMLMHQYMRAALEVNETYTGL